MAWVTIVTLKRRKYDHVTFGWIPFAARMSNWNEGFILGMRRSIFNRSIIEII